MKEGIPFISVEAIVNNKIDFKRKRGYISNEYNEKCNQKYKPQKNDVYLVKSGSTVGKTAIVETNIPFNIWSPLAALRPNNATSPYFLFYLLQTDNLQSQVINKSKGGTQPNLSMRLLEHFKIFVPNNIDYQTQIARLLINVDKIISLQQRKMDNLSKIQKSLENNLFPDINHVRKLKASKNNWHTKKLNNIFNERKKYDQYGQLLSVSMTKGVYPFNPSERKDNSSSNKSNYKVVRKGDIAYNSMRMWQGACGVSKYDGIVSPAYTVITPGSNEDASFYYYYFKNNRMKFKFRRHSQGLTSDTWNLKFPLFKDITIEVPNNEKEQIRIRKLLDTLNEAIKHGNGRIRKLKLLKSFLLQKMFI